MRARTTIGGSSMPAGSRTHFIITSNDMGLAREKIRQLRRSIGVFLDPVRFKQQRLRSSGRGSIHELVEWDALPRPHFAYGLLRSAMLARSLKIDRISALEFGCAGGNGLVALERLSRLVADEIGVEINVFGFDVGEGLPRPADYRDLPYAWKTGQFKMDVPSLRSRLTSAELVIGDVAETVPQFLERTREMPIGFVSFDLDYYSSTVSALRALEGDDGTILPRVYCYFDDIIGPDHELHCEFVGELLAIREFNERHEMRKLARINGLAHKRVIPAPWNDTMFVAHAFDHRLYNEYIPHSVDTDLALG